MDVLIFAPDHGGHRFSFVRHMVKAFNEIGITPWVAITPSGFESDSFREHLQPFSSDMRVHLLPVTPAFDALRSFSRGFALTRLLRSTLRSLNPDHVYIPVGDEISPVMGLLGKRFFSGLPKVVPIEILIVMAGFAYPQRSLRNRVYDWIHTRLTCAFPWRRLHYLDPQAVRHLQRLGLDRRKNLSQMPDPVSPANVLEKAIARNRLNIPAKGLYIGCAGAIDTRKGVDRLLFAYEQAQFDENCRLLLVGKQSDFIENLLSNRFSSLTGKQSIISINRFVADSVIDDAISAMDLVCTPYPYHCASASIVIRAAAAGRPVLGTNTAWMDRTIPAFDLGWTCDTTNIKHFSTELCTATKHAVHFHPSHRNNEFVAYHSIQNFANKWVESLASDSLGR